MAVRREAVLLEVEGNFVSEMGKAAGAAALLKRELDGLDGTNVRAGRSLGGVDKGAKEADESLGGLNKTSSQTSKEIDKLSGRVTILRDLAFTLGPALIPVGAAAVPAIVGLTGAFGAAAAGAGVALAAFHGMGDALKALDAYQLEPTTKNLEALQVQMDKLGPAGAEFVRFLDSLEPQLRSLQMAARNGLLPGVEEGLTSMLRLMPQARRIVFDLATEMGRLSASAGDALSGPRFEAFFNYLETDAAPIMGMFARSLGNIVEGFANLIVAFGPLTRDFNSGMESMTASFARWTAGLASSDGFQGFVDYVRQNGPEVVALIGAIGNAFVGIITAAAPVGEVVLPVLTTLAEILGVIANSPLGTPFFGAVAAAIAFNRAAQLVETTLGKIIVQSESGSRSLTMMGRAGSAAFAALAAYQLAGPIFNDDDTKGVNEYALALTNLAESSKKAAPDLDQFFKADNSNLSWILGAKSQINGLDDALKAIADQRSGLAAAGDEVHRFFGAIDSEADLARKSFDKVDQALAGMVRSGNLDGAAAAFDKIAARAKEQGVSLDKLKSLFPDYEDAIAGASIANVQYAEAAGRAGTAAGSTASQIAGLRTAMQEQTNEAISAFDANTRYGEAVDVAAAAAAKGARGIANSSAAGRENADALSGLAAAWGNQSEAVKNNTKAYAEARANFISTAVKMGVTKAKAHELARQMLEIPDANLKVKLTGAEAAASVLDRLVSKRRVATIIARTVTQGATSILGFKGNADGGSIPKTGLPYADRHPYLLADGEEVISNRYGQADRHRALLKAINANRLAGGGTVGSGIGTAASAGIGTATSLEFYVSVRGLSRALKEASTWSKSETNQRKKMLLGMLAREKAEAESLKRRLDFYRQERAQLTSAVQNRLRTNIFDQPDQQAQVYRQLDRPDNFAQLTPEQQKQFAQTEYQLNQSLGFGQQQAPTSPASALWGDIKNAQEMKTLIRKLKWRGLNGAALSDLLQNASMDQIRALANGSKADVAQYERLYNTRDRLTQQVAGQAGSAAFGDQIRVLAKKYDESLAMQKAIERENRLANSRLRAIEAAAKKIEDATKKVGKDVGREINNAARAGSRGRST